MDIETAVQQANSYREVCTLMGVKTIGGAYRKIRNEIIERGLDTSHFNPFARYGPREKKPLKDICVRGSTFPTSHLRKRLISEGVLEEICAECGTGPEWNNKPLTLQLDHKNGVPDDHRISNLQLLCPNCHTQTGTYCGRNTKT